MRASRAKSALGKTSSGRSQAVPSRCTSLVATSISERGPRFSSPLPTGRAWCVRSTRSTEAALTTARPALSFGRARSRSSAASEAAVRSASPAKPGGEGRAGGFHQRQVGVQHAHDRHLLQPERGIAPRARRRAARRRGRRAAPARSPSSRAGSRRRTPSRPPHPRVHHRPGVGGELPRRGACGRLRRRHQPGRAIRPQRAGFRAEGPLRRRGLARFGSVGAGDGLCGRPQPGGCSGGR